MFCEAGLISTAVVSLAHGQRRRSYSLGTFRSRNKRPEARSKLGAFFLASYLLLPASRTECPLAAYAEQSFARFFTEY